MKRTRRRRRTPLPQAIGTLRSQIEELTAGLKELNGALEPLVAQVGRLGALTKAVAVDSVKTSVAVTPRELAQPIQAMTGPQDLSVNERAARDGLLSQFGGRRNRPDIEADLERDA